MLQSIHASMLKNRSSLRIPLIVLLAVIGWIAGRYFFFLPKYETGQAAPDIEAKLLDGSAFRLADLRGRYVLLHFWGSWCGPCRRENPLIASLYARYGGEAFEVVSIAVEKDAARAYAAAQQDGINWRYQLAEATPSLRFFDAPIANAFGVKRLPYLILIDPQGYIRLVDTDLEHVEALLKRRGQ